MKKFETGDIVIYAPKDSDGRIYRMEIGVVKTPTEDGAFVWYHTGDTASRTNASDLYHIDNLQAFKVERIKL